VMMNKRQRRARAKRAISAQRLERLLTGKCPIDDMACALSAYTCFLCLYQDRPNPQCMQKIIQRYAQ